MGLEQIQVPLELLRTPELTPAAKFLWIVFRLDEVQNRSRSIAPTLLAERTGLARSTVYQALAQLEAASWCTIHRERGSGKRRMRTHQPHGTSKRCVGIPVVLVRSRVAAMGSRVPERRIGEQGIGERGSTDRDLRRIDERGLRESRQRDLRGIDKRGAREAGKRREHGGRPGRGLWIVRGGVRPQAVVCFGLLQGLDGCRPGAKGGFKGAGGEFKWAELSKATGLHLRTVKRALRSLVEAGWVALRQSNRVAPIQFVLQDPDEAWREAARARLQQCQFLGQQTMLEFLTLIVPSRVFSDDGATGFLVNPRTQQLLQFDRFYPLYGVAFEFNGEQHYRPTERFSKEQVVIQQERDAVKRAICVKEGITLIVVHAEDLSLDGMLRKIGNLLPRRDLSLFPKTIQYLEQVGRRYVRRISA